MEPNRFRSAIAQSIDSLHTKNTDTDGSSEEQIDMGGFTSSLIKELLNLQIPVYDVRVSTYRHNVLVLELPFCKACEISVDSIEFGGTNKQVTLYIDKEPVRRIKLEKLDSKYLNAVAIALVDYFKRYLLLKNKFTEK